MHATVKFDGLMDKILAQAVKQGLAKTKTEALRLGVLELNNKYELMRLAIEEQEDLEDVEYVRKAQKQLAEGKLKLLGEKELRKALRT